MNTHSFLWDPLNYALFPEPLARLAVWCALSSYSSHKGQASSRQKKRHREDIEVGPLLTCLCVYLANVF